MSQRMHPNTFMHEESFMARQLTQAVSILQSEGKNDRADLIMEMYIEYREEVSKYIIHVEEGFSTLDKKRKPVLLEVIAAMKEVTGWQAKRSSELKTFNELFEEIISGFESDNPVDTNKDDKE